MNTILSLIEDTLPAIFFSDFQNNNDPNACIVPLMGDILVVILHFSLFCLFL